MRTQHFYQRPHSAVNLNDGSFFRSSFFLHLMHHCTYLMNWFECLLLGARQCTRLARKLCVCVMLMCDIFLWGGLNQHISYICFSTWTNPDTSQFFFLQFFFFFFFIFYHQHEKKIYKIVHIEKWNRVLGTAYCCHPVCFDFILFRIEFYCVLNNNNNNNVRMNEEKKVHFLRLL